MDQYQKAVLEAFRANLSPEIVKPLVLLLALVSVVIILNLITHRLKASKSRKALTKKPILTASEIAFFNCLIEALPSCHIFPQVSLGALIEPKKGISGREKIALHNTYSQKRPDFVICQKGTLDVIAIIELDDKTHNKHKDRQRDALLNGVGYRVERFSQKDKPWTESIRERLTIND